MLSNTFNFGGDSLGDYVYLFGELCNPTSGNVSVIKYSIDALDASGNVIETKNVTDYRYLPASERLCINVILYIKPKNVARYRYTVFESQPADVQPKKLEVVDAEYDAIGNLLTGRIRNASNNTVTDIGVSVVMYGRDGRVIGCNERATLNSTELYPDQLTSYQAWFYPSAGAYAGHLVVAIGR